MTSTPASRQYERYAASLPVWGIADEVNSRLSSHPTLVVTAPPGAGKSTLLPLTLLHGVGADGGKVLVLEPRRLAARQIAERMASMLGERVGQTVGYRVRFDSQVSSTTRIEVLTEGILTRMLVDDPTLDGVGVVVFDEFHERSLTSDLALALTREAQQVIRPDLRIVVMSATIDTADICHSLDDAPLVESAGRMYPVRVEHVGDDEVVSPRMTPQEVATAVCRAIVRAHADEEGDILAFLPGETEIRRCQELIGSQLGGTRVCPLFGMLSPEEQRQAIMPSRSGERRVVLATSIAETSLTIEGVRIVVDSGLCRRMVYDARTGLSHLETVPVSRDMATQRTGRAGRVAPGLCRRLWSRATDLRMEETRTPEILTADLSPMLLDIAAWGGQQADSLAWLTPPPAAAMQQAASLLRLLGALDADGRITTHGRRLSTLPCHPRIAQMLVSAADRGLSALAADMAALLEAPPALFQPRPGEAPSADIRDHLSNLQRARHQHSPRWERTLRTARAYLDIVKRIAPAQAPTQLKDTGYEVGQLLAEAYPERVAMAVEGSLGHYRLASGENALLGTDDCLSASDALAIASLHGGGSGRIALAAPVVLSSLTSLMRTTHNISWDNRQGILLMRNEQRIGKLVVASRPLGSDCQEEAFGVLAAAAVKYGTSMFTFSDEVQGLQRRVAAVSEWHPELSLPSLATDAVLQRAAEWLPFYGQGATNVATLRKIDMQAVLWSLLSYEQQQAVDRLAPSHLTMPNGRRHRVEYRQGAELPILRIRLQECFGMMDTPRVDGGQRPILLELLSPGFKPVQLTQDLRSFWSTTYFEVRKELRRRYPKHAWPEDPQSPLSQG